MAAVYAAQEGSVSVNATSLSSEYSKDTSQEDTTVPVWGDKVLNAEGSEMEGDVTASRSDNEAQERAELAAVNAFEPQTIVIKEEQVEGNDYVTVQLGDFGEDDSEEQTDREVVWTGGGESTDGQPAYEMMEKDPDWAPSLNLCTSDAYTTMSDRRAQSIHRLKMQKITKEKAQSLGAKEVPQHVREEVKQQVAEEKVAQNPEERDWPLVVEKSSKAFESKEGNLEHRREHTHDGPIVCLDIDSQWNDLLVSTDGGRRTLCCAICGRKFSSSRGFFAHQLKHRNKGVKQQSVPDTGQGIINQKLFECNDCGKTFASVGQCLNHQRSHKQASKSVFHQLDHLKKKSFQCPTCGRSYSRASALDAHRRCHEVKLVKSRVCETEKPQSGNEVSVKSEEPSDASPEQTDESPKKLFECLCGKSFRTLCGLATHQRFSTSCLDAKVKVNPKRSYDCNECGKSFVSAMSLQCHQRWHKRRAEHLDSGQSFKCKECGKAFTSLTFYNKHQRIAHSKEMPAKSFLHQVFQLQKKAFECQDCGRRFSRASALQSHQLCHTDVFSDILEGSSKTSPKVQASSAHESDQNVDDHFVVDIVECSQDATQTEVHERRLSGDSVGGDPQMEVDDHFEVVSITTSDGYTSDSANPGDQNPDLELVCESDQEEKEDLCFNLSQDTSSVSCQPEIVNPEMNVKIVQIDFEHLKRELSTTEIDRSPPQESKKFSCSDCNRTFDKAVSLRCHMLWHRGAMGKKNIMQTKMESIISKRVLLKCDICGHESVTKTSHDFHLAGHEDRKPYKSVMYQLANLQKNSFKCEVCEMLFSRLSALHAHQQLHNKEKKTFKCLQCFKLYSTRGGLYHHQKGCCHKEDDNTDKKVDQFNPTKSLLGPKEHHCKKCGKGFWSLGAYYYHKQYSQCASVKTSHLEAPSQPKDGRVRRKRRGRKRGLVSRKTSVSGQVQEKQHKCDICGKSYRLLACFLKHQLVHNTDGSARAVKSFDYQVEQLQKNSYSCPDCSKCFSRAMALQFHMKCHGYETGLALDEAKLPSSSDSPQCQICLSFFTSEVALQIHQKQCIKAEESKALLEVDQKEERVKAETSPENNMQVPKQEDETVQDSESLKVQSSATADFKYKSDDCGRDFSVVGAPNFHKRILNIGSFSTSIKSKWQNVPQEKFQKPLAKTSFTCSECGKKFSTNAALGTHKRWHKDKKMAKYMLKNNMLARKNTSDGPFLCNLCGKGFFYLCVLRRHQKHHPPLQEQTSKPTDLNNTVSISAVHNSVGESFSTEEQALHQAGEPTSSSPLSKLSTDQGGKAKARYQCPQCCMSFLCVRGLRAHKWQKHRKARGRPSANSNRDTNVFPCKCGKLYSSQGAFYNHKKRCQETNQDEKPQVKSHVAESTSLLHNLVESPTKCLFRCQKCGKAFPSEAQLDMHKEAARSRPHCCALCCRGYWTETQLQQHLAWHDEVRRRLPTELRYRLNSSGSSGPLAKLHLSAYPTEEKRTTPAKLLITAAKFPPTKDYKCPHCEEMFLSKFALQTHQVVHKRDGPYRCSLCPQTFGEIRDLIDHHQDCLGDKELKEAAPLQDTENLTCIECGTSFRQETDLHQHYIEHARGVL